MKSQQRLSYHVAITVDGFIARNDDSYDCFLNDGPHVADFFSTIQQYGSVLMGRRTYEGGLKLGVSNPYPWLQTVVFSRSLRPDLEPKVEITAHDPLVRVQALKAESGKGIWLCGGAQLASQLLGAGLVDELVVKLNPVLLGQGISLAATLPHHLPLTLRTSKIYENGVVLLRYDVQTA